MLVRSWNVFHGNSDPPQRRAFLAEMMRLATADDPDIVCLQEVPVWALRRLETWSGMQAFGTVAARPRLGSAELGRWITEIHHGFFRSALTGQANAILVAQRHRTSNPTSAHVSERGEGERRVVQTVEVEDIGLVANFHVSSAFADTQFLRVVEVIGDVSPVVLCGDANLQPGRGRAYAELARLGYSQPAARIDQILVRGLEVAERAREGGHVLDDVVLSDHTPIELRVA